MTALTTETQEIPWTEGLGLVAFVTIRQHVTPYPRLKVLFDFKAVHGHERFSVVMDQDNRLVAAVSDSSGTKLRTPGIAFEDYGDRLLALEVRLAPVADRWELVLRTSNHLEDREVGPLSVLGVSRCRYSIGDRVEGHEPAAFELFATWYGKMGPTDLDAALEDFQNERDSPKALVFGASPKYPPTFPRYVLRVSELAANQHQDS